MNLNWLLISSLIVLLTIGLTTRTVDASKRQSEEENEEEEESTSTDTDTDTDTDDDDDKKGKAGEIFNVAQCLY